MKAKDLCYLKQMREKRKLLVFVLLMKFKATLNILEIDLLFSEASFSVQKAVYEIALLKFD